MNLPCVFVTGDGRSYESRTVTTNNVAPSLFDSGFSVARSGTYSDQRLPLPANQELFSLTDVDYACRQETISRPNQAVSLPNQSYEYPRNNYSFHSNWSSVSVPQPVTIQDQWTNAIPVNDDDFVLAEILATDTQADPFLPHPPSDFDDGFGMNFPMDAGVDLMRHAGGVMGEEGMDVLNGLDLSVLEDFACLPVDDLIDPMLSLSPTMVPSQSSELSPSSSASTVTPLQSSEVSTSSTPVFASVLPADIQAVVPSAIVPPTATRHGGDIDDCLEMLKLMKPSKGNTQRQMDTFCSPAVPYKGQLSSAPPVDTAQVRAPPSSLPLSSQSGLGMSDTAVAMTPTMPGRPVCASASGLLQCSSQTTNAEHVFEIADAATGMRKSPTKFLAHLFTQIQTAVKIQCDLKVAHHHRAKLPVATFESNKLVLKIPNNCIPLAQWALQGHDLKECVLVMQEVINTLADIHVNGASEHLSLWGCFSVWVGVGAGRKVYLVPNFLELLQKQQDVSILQEEVNTVSFDMMFVSQLVTELMSYLPAHQTLSNALHQKLLEIALGSVCQMIQVARVLGEKRLCKLDVNCSGCSLMVYCLEQEKLFEALQPVKSFLPWTTSSLWSAHWLHNGTTTAPVRNTEMSTPDRQMTFELAPHSVCVPCNPQCVFIRK